MLVLVLVLTRLLPPVSYPPEHHKSVMYDNNQRYGQQPQHTAPPYAQPAPAAYNYGYGPPPAQPLYPPQSQQQQQAYVFPYLSLLSVYALTGTIYACL